MLYQIDIAPYMEIVELPIAGHPERAELVLRQKINEHRIAAVVVEAGGTVYQLRYPTTKSYGGPQTAEGIAALMLRAGERCESLPYA